MPQEIERKFLVCDESWRESATGTFYRQGYLSRDRERMVRVRVAGARAFLTIKGYTTAITRPEYEYEIPLAEANEMLDDLCERPLIEKMRYRLEVDGMTWELDHFHGENEGLVVAEIELTAEDQPFSRPPWLGREVTGETRYLNSNLVKRPFSSW